MGSEIIFSCESLFTGITIAYSERQLSHQFNGFLVRRIMRGNCLLSSSCMFGFLLLDFNEMLETVLLTSSMNSRVSNRVPLSEVATLDTSPVKA